MSHNPNSVDLEIAWNMTETPQDLLRVILDDRAAGTEDHWWASQVGDFYLDDDFGEYDLQKSADKRRMMRVPAVERELAASLAREAELREALAWYGEQSRLCRLVHSGGDTGRKALSDDGGTRALAALEAPK